MTGLNKVSLIFLVSAAVLFFSHAAAFARDHNGRSGGPPPVRKHTVLQKSPLELVPAMINLSTPSVKITAGGGKRTIQSNGIPAHTVGKFPNCGNPHAIKPQEHEFKVTLKPELTGRPEWLKSGWVFGIAVNGITWEPLAAEWYLGQRNSQWRYEALSGGCC